MGVLPAAKRPGGASSVTRRGALGVGALAVPGAALVLAGCGAHAPHPKKVSRLGRGDIPVLTRLLELEYRTVAAYEAGIPLLASGSDLYKAAQQFLLQNEAHVGELQGLLKKAGLKPPPRQPLTPGLGNPTDAAQLVDLLAALEAATIAAYLAALPGLSDSGARQALAGVLANDAQHLAVLRESRHRPPAPTALVTGHE